MKIYSILKMGLGWMAGLILSTSFLWAGNLGETAQNGTEFTHGDYLLSSNGNYQAVFQGDGNFVVYRTTDGHARWNSGTQNRGANLCAFQGDGNLVVYTVYEASNGYWTYEWNDDIYDYEWVWIEVEGTHTEYYAHWHTSTHGRGGARLVMQNDGNLVIYTADGRALWHIGAEPPPPPETYRGSSLAAGQQIQNGDFLLSPNGQYKFIYKYDGNLVIFNTVNGSATWASNTSGYYGGYSGWVVWSYQTCLFDGRLTLTETAGIDDGQGATNYEYNEFWSSSNYASPGVTLTLRDDGSLVILDAQSNVVWNTAP
jgi:hypothetical protein